MEKVMSDVKDFHDLCGLPVAQYPQVPLPERCDLRLHLIEEEYSELRAAIDNDDMIKIADGCADLIYVIAGLALEYGIDLSAVWDEVHRSNMEKSGGPKAANGKQLKPAGWKPPDIYSAVYGIAKTE